MPEGRGVRSKERIDRKRDADIKKLREEGKTLDFIAGKHGISRERVRQICKRLGFNARPYPGQKINYKNSDWKTIAMHNTKIIDDLITLFDLADRDLNIVDNALEAVAGVAKREPNQPVTVWLAEKLRKKHLL